MFRLVNDLMLVCVTEEPTKVGLVSRIVLPQLRLRSWSSQTTITMTPTCDDMCVTPSTLLTISFLFLECNLYFTTPNSNNTHHHKPLFPSSCRGCHGCSLAYSCVLSTDVLLSGLWLGSLHFWEGESDVSCTIKHWVCTILWYWWGYGFITTDTTK